MAFKPGDVVVLKSGGGPKMTVAATRDDKPPWKKESSAFHPDQLKLAE